MAYVGYPVAYVDYPVAYVDYPVAYVGCTVIWYTVIWLHGYFIETRLFASEYLHRILCLDSISFHIKNQNSKKNHINIVL